MEKKTWREVGREYAKRVCSFYRKQMRGGFFRAFVDWIFSFAVVAPTVISFHVDTISGDALKKQAPEIITLVIAIALILSFVIKVRRQLERNQILLITHGVRHLITESKERICPNNANTGTIARGELDAWHKMLHLLEDEYDYKHQG